ncbi:hypothetical protein ACFV2S_09670 [Streptomyces sp. NPDC059695]|uniref:hypothetical protein n=1 Tax=Streptomyces sp. NPDC059695 TaxID=3346910 RepID=UPI0036B4DEE8
MSSSTARGASPVASRRFVSRIGHAASLLPASLITLGLVAAGRSDRARAWWARVDGQDPAAPSSARRPGAGRLAAHALMSVPLGLLALVPVGVEILFVLRGVLYPVVDHGPYDHSWGGPSMAGAWAAHFLVGLALAVAGLGVLWLLDRLHFRLAGWTWGRKVGAGAVCALPVLCAAGVVLVIAWTHQL